MNEVHSPLRWYQMNEHCKVWTHLCHSLLAVSSPTLRQFVSWAQGPASTTAEIKQWRGRNNKSGIRGGQDGRVYLLHWSWLTLASCLQLFYDACKWNDLDTMALPLWPLAFSHTSHTAESFPECLIPKCLIPECLILKCLMLKCLTECKHCWYSSNWQIFKRSVNQTGIEQCG